MQCKTNEDESEYYSTYHIQNIIPVRTDHIGIVDHDGIHKPVRIPCLHGPELIQGGHKP